MTKVIQERCARAQSGLTRRKGLQAARRISTPTAHAAHPYLTLSTFNFQLSTFNFQLSTFNFQLNFPSNLELRQSLELRA